MYIVEKISIDKEFYLSMTLDRKAGTAVFIYSPAGGVNIEEVAEKTPEKIFKLPVDISQGPDVEKLVEAAKNLGIEEHKS